MQFLAAGLYLLSGLTAAAAASNPLLDVRHQWAMASKILFGLGVLRAVDAHVAAASLARELIRDISWYEHHRLIQTGASLFAFLAICGSASLALRTRRVNAILERLLTAVLGLLIGLIFMRSLSLHYVDEVLGRRLGPLSLAGLLEMALLVCVIGIALVQLCGWLEHDTN